MKTDTPAHPHPSLKHLEGVIFDMDGVIVDSEPRHQQAFMDIFHEIGYADNHAIQFEDYLGKSDRAVWDDFMEIHQPSFSIEDLTARKQNRLIDLLQSEQPIFETLPQLVEKLSQRFSLSVASGSLHPVIDVVLELEDLRRFFPTVVSVEDVLKGKPAPDIFLRAAEGMNVKPDKICVIEDSAAGVQAGKSAGMSVIAITNSLEPAALSMADFVVDDYESIESLLLGSSNKLNPQ
jgi:beta-phosphoglucomutase-like phosphatase (HAD superfamily)